MEIIKMIQVMTPDQRAELFSYIQEYFCIICGEEVGREGFCTSCSDEDYKD